MVLGSPQSSTGTRLLLAALVAASIAAALLATQRPASHAAGERTTIGGVGRWLTYPDGRVFLPHGVNTVVTAPPYRNDRFTEADARFLAEEGLTAVRVAVLPSALEPVPGELDHAYVQAFVRQAAMLARYGIATLVDVNQDRYARLCSGDGFPAWAVLGSCDDDPELGGVAAWNAFWRNEEVAGGNGIQEHYFAWWRMLATAFRSSTSLLGYDLLNEPKAKDEATLAQLWRRTVDTVASADAAHVSFVEPRDPAHPGFPGSFPRGTGFAGHVYCATTLWSELSQETPAAAEIASCIRDDRVMLTRQLAYARSAGLAFLVGEFGAADELTEQRALVDAMATRFVPWLVYAYNTRLDSSGTPGQALLVDERLHGSQANAKQGKLDALVVPYPLAVAGTPASWRYDRKTRRVTFSYSTARVGGGSFAGAPPTVVFVPKRVYPTGYRVEVGGATVVSAATAPWLRLVAKPGATRVSLTILPRGDSRTLTPLEANRCGFTLRRCG